MHFGISVPEAWTRRHGTGNSTARKPGQTSRQLPLLLLVLLLQLLLMLVLQRLLLIVTVDDAAILVPQTAGMNMV